jgi:transcriptional regulator with XRE-family HTH domain
VIIVFDYSKLLGRIREFGFTQDSLAKHIKINAGTLSLKLNNKANFTAEEIDKISEALDISVEEIGVYFFTKKVWKNQTN